ncbi:hypothetical protein METSCH_B10970 [Metschnikowia aff. pulcherrima]|uniref:Rare lipoprotein A (RlpA)-like double-psi beta-barrel n=1 Tax=Metschnikowia aff. pulcherrima TaxID=2163413 RepID=A0A4V1AE40_9ASCO|nr:hypothetical protein METSCH_B10970 [Metschnikowia aff. pulcherrima]
MELLMLSYSSKMHVAAIAIIMFAAFAAALPGVKMETRLVEYYTTLAYYTTVPIYYADPTKTFTSAVSSLETKTFHVVYTEEVLVSSSDEGPLDLSTSTYATPILLAVSELMSSEFEELDYSSGALFEPISSTFIESDLVSVSSEYNDQSTEIASSVSAIVDSEASISIMTFESVKPDFDLLFENGPASIFDGPLTSAEPSSEAYLTVAQESGVPGAEIFPEPTEIPDLSQSTTYADADELGSHSEAPESRLGSTLLESLTSWVSEATEEPGMETPEPLEPGIDVSEALESYSSWSYSTTFTDSVPSEFFWDLEDPDGAYQKTQDEFPMFPEAGPSYTTEGIMGEQLLAAVADSVSRTENLSVTPSPVSEETLLMVSTSLENIHYHLVGTIEEPVWESVLDLEPTETFEEKFAKLTAAPSSIESEPGLEPTIINSESLVTFAGLSDPAEQEGMITAESLESVEATSSLDYDLRESISEESGPSFSEGYDVTDDAIVRSTATPTENFLTELAIDESSESILSLSVFAGETHHQSTIAPMSSDPPEETDTFGDSGFTAGEATETGVSQNQSSVGPFNTLLALATSAPLSVPDEFSSVIEPESSTSSTLMIQTSLSEDTVISSLDAAASWAMVDTKRELGSESILGLATATAAKPSEMTESGMPLVSVPDEHVATHTSLAKCDCCKCPAITSTPVFVAAPSVQMSEAAFSKSIAEPNTVTTGATQGAIVKPTETDTTTFLEITSSSDSVRESTEAVQIETEDDLTTSIATRTAAPLLATPVSTETAEPPFVTSVPTETEVLPLASLVATETATLADAERIEPILVDTVMSDSTMILPETSTDSTSAPTIVTTSVQSSGETLVTTEVAPVQSIVTVTHTLAPEQPPYVPPENPFRGDATFFYPDMGACGWVNSGNDLVAAVNKNLFDKYAQGSSSQQNPLCGMKVNAHYGERSVAVSVVDTLGAGNVNDIGLSPVAFAQLADKRKKKIKVTWDLE